MVVPLIRSPALLGVDGLRHGLTTRAGGVSAAPFDALNLGRATEDDPVSVAQNHTRLARALGFEHVAFLKQVHGNTIAEAPAAQGAQAVPKADGWFLDQPGHAVGILGADCPGVLIVAPTQRTLVLLHAGWRGTAAGIVAAGVARLRARGVDPHELIAVIGVGIGAPAYEVDTPVLEAVAASCGTSVAELGEAISPTREGHALLDLPAVLERHLLQEGLAPDRIDRLRGCTFEEPGRFFSHRRDGSDAGRHALVAGWEA